MDVYLHVHIYCILDAYICLPLPTFGYIWVIFRANVGKYSIHLGKLFRSHFGSSKFNSVMSHIAMWRHSLRSTHEKDWQKRDKHALVHWIFPSLVHLDFCSARALDMLWANNTLSNADYLGTNLPAVVSGPSLKVGSNVPWHFRSRQLRTSLTCSTLTRPKVVKQFDPEPIFL